MFSVRQLHAHFVGEVKGLDLRDVRDAALVTPVQAAIDRDAVLVFRDQSLDDDALIAFSRHFGPLHTSITLVDKENRRRLRRPELSDISNVAEDGTSLSPGDRKRRQQLANLLWHTDNSFRKPSGRYTLLAARILPPEGGETEFADTRAAYDALEPAMKARIETLAVEHTLARSRILSGTPEIAEAERAHLPPTVQPLVGVHPNSGRKSLLLGSPASRIIGWPEAEGRALLDTLEAFATAPRFVYVHHWRPGDVVMWDNRATLHRGLRYDLSVRRDLRRTTTLAANIEAG